MRPHLGSEKKGSIKKKGKKGWRRRRSGTSETNTRSITCGAGKEKDGGALKINCGPKRIEITKCGGTNAPNRAENAWGSYIGREEMG